MIASMLSFTMHVLASSFKVLGPVHRVLEYIVPQYRNMAAKSIKAPKINFDTKHLRKGDPLPPFNGKLRVYNMRYCPYAQRTILALNAKQIDYEVVNVHLMDKPEWLTTKSAFGKVPAIEIEEGVTIYESLVTVDYIDDVYAQRPLRSRDPLRRAQDQILVEATSPLASVFSKLIRAPDTIDEAVLDRYYKALDFLQDELRKRATAFLGGGEPGYADYMNWPWLERMRAFKTVDARIRIDTPKYKLLNEYAQRMSEDPAVSQYAVPDEVVLKVMDGYKPGNTPDYDLMLK